MRRKFFLCACVCFLIILLMPAVYTRTANNQSNVELRIIPSKLSYILGESNVLVFEIINNNDEPISLVNYLDGTAGYLDVYIAQNGGDFKKYQGAGWGKGGDGITKMIALKPGESVENTESIFWNSKPIIPTTIAKDVIERSISDKIMSYYAFSQPGTHRIKASYRLHLSNQNEPVVVESSPVTIMIEEPVGRDLEVWNRIKNNGDFAYFIQEGNIRIPTYKTAEREKFKQDIEQIITEYPNSFYAESVRQSMEKFQTIEEKRLAATKKIK